MGNLFFHIEPIYLWKLSSFIYFPESEHLTAFVLFVTIQQDWLTHRASGYGLCARSIFGHAYIYYDQVVMQGSTRDSFVKKQTFTMWPWCHYLVHFLAYVFHPNNELSFCDWTPSPIFNSVKLETWFTIGYLLHKSFSVYCCYIRSALLLDDFQPKRVMSAFRGVCVGGRNAISSAESHEISKKNSRKVKVHDLMMLPNSVMPNVLWKYSYAHPFFYKRTPSVFFIFAEQSMGR